MILPAAVASGGEAPMVEKPIKTSLADQPGWKLAAHEDFSGDIEGWEVISADPSKGPRYAQYEPQNVVFTGDSVDITSYRHCGVEPTIQNRQTAPCPEGVPTLYTSGRIEQIDHTIKGDFKVFIKAKMTVDKNELLGTRYELWANNLTKYPDTRNLGYCIEGTRPNGEFDPAEIFNTKFATANNIAHCEDGKLYDVPRKLRMPEGWLKKTVRLTATRVNGKMEFEINGEALPLRSDSDRTVDRLRDFKGVSWDEFNEVQDLPYGMIFSTAVNTFADSKNFRPVDDDEPYKPHTLSIQDMKLYTR